MDQSFSGDFNDFQRTTLVIIDCYGDRRARFSVGLNLKIQKLEFFENQS